MFHFRVENFLAFWFAITEPFDSVQGEAERRQSRLLASTCLVLAFASVGLFIPNCFDALGNLRFLESAALFTSGALMLVFYRLSRSIYNRFVIPAFIALGAVILFLPVFLTDAVWGHRNLYYLLATITFSGVFLPLRTTVGIFLTQMAFMVLLGFTVSSGFDNVRGPIQFNLFMGALTITICYYSRYVEAKRRAQVAASERRYRMLVENVRDIVYEHSIDGKLLSINGITESMSGWSMEEMIGQPIMNFIHPDDQQKINLSPEVALKMDSLPPVELRLRSKTDGYRTFEFKSTPQIEKGRIVSVSGVGRDVTERTQAETRLRESQRFIQQITDTAPYIIYVYDLNKRGTIYMNRFGVSFYGQSLEAIQQAGNRFWADHVHPEDMPRLSPISVQFATAEDDKAFVQEYRVLNGSGEWRWLRTHEVIFKRQADLPEQILGVAQDITEQKKAEEQAMQLLLERERFGLFNRFALSLSHDFRTSLATIETSRYLIERIVQPAVLTTIQPKMDNIQLHVDRMAEQLKNLNSIYGLSTTQMEPFDLSLIVNSLIGEHTAAADNLGIQLGFVADEALPKVSGDSDKIKAALKHLVVNALSHTPSGGCITINASARDSYIFIDVRDTGEGIAEHDLPYIFDVFYRADQARALESGGVGLGLSIVRMIADAHGGSVTASSQPGKGSVFTLRLPRA